MYGVTHVISVDSFSNYVTSFIVKNNLVIYDTIIYTGKLLDLHLNCYGFIGMLWFRTSIHGLWNQLRIDHGREFYLMLHAHEKLRRRYGPHDILPYAQTPSHRY